MQIQVSASAHPPNAKTADVKRRSAGYQPSIWGGPFPFKQLSLSAGENVILFFQKSVITYNK